MCIYLDLSLYSYTIAIYLEIEMENDKENTVKC